MVKKHQNIQTLDVLEEEVVFLKNFLNFFKIGKRGLLFLDFVFSWICCSWILKLFKKCFSWKNNWVFSEKLLRFLKTAIHGLFLLKYVSCGFIAHEFQKLSKLETFGNLDGYLLEKKIDFFPEIAFLARFFQNAFGMVFLLRTPQNVQS